MVKDWSLALSLEMRQMAERTLADRRFCFSCRVYCADRRAFSHKIDLICRPLRQCFTLLDQAVPASGSHILLVVLLSPS